MAKNQNTFEKRRREADKKRKAQEKREKRGDKKTPDEKDVSRPDGPIDRFEMLDISP